MKKSFILLFTVFFCFSSSVSATVKKSEKKPPKSTATHAIGFTFHKLAGSEPDFNKWVEVYTKGQLQGYGEQGRKEFIRRVKAKFRSNFNNFHMQREDDFVILLPAKLEIVPFEKRYLMNITIDGALDFIIKETPEFLINLVIPTLEDKFKTVITGDDYKEIKKNAPSYSFEKPTRVMVAVYAEPVSVDAEKPLTVDQSDYWLMLMKFKTFEIWNIDVDKHYWTYISEEQRAQNLNDLRALYKFEEEN